MPSPVPLRSGASVPKPTCESGGKLKQATTQHGFGNEQKITRRPINVAVGFTCLCLKLSRMRPACSGPHEAPPWPPPCLFLSLLIFPGIQPSSCHSGTSGQTLKSTFPINAAFLPLSLPILSLHSPRGNVNINTTVFSVTIPVSTASGNLALLVLWRASFCSRGQRAPFVSRRLTLQTGLSDRSLMQVALKQLTCCRESQEKFTNAQLDAKTCPANFSRWILMALTPYNNPANLQMIHYRLNL